MNPLAIEEELIRMEDQERGDRTSSESEPQAGSFVGEKPASDSTVGDIQAGDAGYGPSRPDSPATARAGETVSRRAHNPETPGSTPGRATSEGVDERPSPRSIADAPRTSHEDVRAPSVPLSPSRRALGQALLEWGRKL
jgi:hypothetical protein